MDNAFDLTVNALRGQGLNSDEILKELSKMFQVFSTSANVAQIKDSDEEKIRMLLNKLCVPVENRGYKCWIIAIKEYKKADSKIRMKEVYNKVGEKCEISPKFAERAMRHAIKCATLECEEETLKEIFGHNISSRTGRPKNGQFIAVLSELI